MRVLRKEPLGGGSAFPFIGAGKGNGDGEKHGEFGFMVLYLYGDQMTEFTKVVVVYIMNEYRG